MEVLKEYLITMKSKIINIKLNEINIKKNSWKNICFTFKKD